MPTEPVREILDPEYSAVDAMSFADLACPIIRETLNHGTWVVKRCERAPDVRGGVDEDIAPIVLYRQVLEMIDGVEVLLRQGCALAITPLLRSAFEAGMGLRFIALRKESRINLAWMTTYTPERLRLYRGLARGGEVRQAWQQQYGRLPEVVKDLTGAIANLEAFLAREHLQPINAEYLRLRTAGRRRPPWYSFFDGPSNLHELARHLKQSAEYGVLYGPWSRLAHGNDFASYAVSPKGEGLAWRSIRSPEQLHNSANLAVAFVLSATQSLLRYARPGESIRAWYLREIRGPYRQLRDLQVTINYPG